MYALMRTVNRSCFVVNVTAEFLTWRRQFVKLCTPPGVTVSRTSLPLLLFSLQTLFLFLVVVGEGGCRGDVSLDTFGERNGKVYALKGAAKGSSFVVNVIPELFIRRQFVKLRRSPGVSVQTAPDLSLLLVTSQTLVFSVLRCVGILHIPRALSCGSLT